ncbi:hypothetical protein LINPERHAP2_LOCUS41372 [Linum perenne]
MAWNRTTRNRRHHRSSSSHKPKYMILLSNVMLRKITYLMFFLKWGWKVSMEGF